VDAALSRAGEPCAEASVDVLIANNVVHHLAYPDRFFRGAARVLRPGGHLLIQECNCSWTTRIALRATGHEGYDFSADPFDPTRPCNDPADPWSANCAIPNLLFDDLRRFGTRYPEFAVVDSGMSEFFVKFNSGGVTATVPYLPLPGARCTLSMSSTACSSPSRPVCSRASAASCYGAFSRQSGHPVAGSAPARS